MTLEQAFQRVMKGEAELEALKQRPDVEFAIPWCVSKDGDNRFHSVIVGHDQRLRAMTTAGSDSELTEIDAVQLSQSPILDTVGPWEVSAVLLDEDAIRGRRFIERVADEVGSNFPNHGLVPRRADAERITERRKTCHCHASEQRTVVQITADGQPYKKCLCKDCGTLHAIHLDGIIVTPDELVDADWLLEDFPGTVIEIDRATDFLVVANKNTPRLNAMLELLSDVGRTESEYFASFEPGEQEALVYVTDTTVAGFLSWSEPTGFQVLRQLYIRQPTRRRGFAESLVRTWIERYCQSDSYYLDQPNGLSWPLFNKLNGEYTDDGPTAREYFALNSIIALL